MIGKTSRKSVFHGLIGKQCGGGISFHRGVKYQKGSGLGGFFGPIVDVASDIASKAYKWAKPYIGKLLGFAAPAAKAVARTGRDIITSAPVRRIAEETAVNATVNLLSGKSPQDTLKEVHTVLKEQGKKVLKSPSIKKKIRGAILKSTSDVLKQKKPQLQKHMTAISDEIIKSLETKKKQKSRKRKRVTKGKKKKGKKVKDNLFKPSFLDA